MISRVSFTGMLVYRLVMSSEARANWWRIGVSSSFLIRSLVFSRLCVGKRGHHFDCLGEEAG